MVSAVGHVSPQQTILVVAMAIVLPIILVGLGLMFAKGVLQLKTKPKANLILGLSLGILYIVLLANSLAGLSNKLEIFSYGACAIFWPVYGVMQYRAKLKSSKEPLSKQ